MKLTLDQTEMCKAIQGGLEDYQHPVQIKRDAVHVASIEFDDVDGVFVIHLAHSQAKVKKVVGESAA